METSDRIKVLVVDDHPIVRVGIAAIINARPDMTTVAQTGTAEEAIQLFEQHQPDITLMDLRLPRMSGVEAIRTIRARHPKACFVVVTTYEGDEDIYQAIEAGARAYVIKGMPHEALTDALRRVHAGGRFLPPPVSRALAARTPDSDLSSREREVLSLLARGRTNKEIAAGLGITVATVSQAEAAGNFQQAAADYREAVELDPAEPLLAYKLAMALDKAGNRAEERAALEQALQDDPHMAVAQNQLGYLDSVGGNTDSAIHRFQLAVQADPGYTKAWLNLAAELCLESRWRDARAALTHLLELDPSSQPGHALLQRLNEIDPQS